MATGYFASQYFTTTLSVVGGINDSQTTGIVIQSTTGIQNTAKPGVALINYADPLNETIAEWVTFSSINSTTKTLQGVTRGAEKGSAKSHSNGVTVAFPISESHINPLVDAVSIGGDATNIITGVLDEDTMSSNSAVKVPTQQSVKAYVDTEISGISLSTDGWIDKSTETWTRTGNYSFTISGDVTEVYTKGTKVRYKDGSTYEYGYVESSVYSAPNTTITLVTNADYAMASATITNQGVSYAENPQGFPEWFSFTTTFGGFSANPSTTTIYFKIEGLMCTFYYVDGSDGTSNATTTSFTLPVASKRNRNMAGFIGIKDNGTISSTPGHLTLAASSKTANAWKTFSQGAWTSSGAKNVFIPETQYEWT